jgi:hypothetical protein
MEMNSNKSVMNMFRLSSPVNVSRGSAVGIATDCGLDDRGVRVRAR